jgi:addiction module HigA family antidote
MHTIAIHPGKVLLDELQERGIKPQSLAGHIGVSPGVIGKLCRGHGAISALLAVKLSLALGASPAFWLNLQKNWELSQVKRRSLKKIKPIAA